MHELSITRNIVAIAADHAGGRKICRVVVHLGRFAGVMADAVSFCFPLVAEGTLLEGASLEIRMIDGKGRCNQCGAEFTMPELYTPCSCGCRSVTRLQGEELTVASMELERTD